MSQSKEVSCQELLHLQEEVNKLKVKKEVQRELVDMYYERFEKVTSLPQDRDAKHHTLAMKYKERKQRVINWIDDHTPLAPQMLGQDHLWPDSDAELDNGSEEDPEKEPLEYMPIDNHPMGNGVEDQDGAEHGQEVEESRMQTPQQMSSRIGLGEIFIAIEYYSKNISTQDLVIVYVD